MTFNIILLALPMLILGYIIMTNAIYFLAPTKKWESFPEKCNVKTKCTRVADYNNRGYGLEVIKSKYDINILQEKIIDIIKTNNITRNINPQSYTKDLISILFLSKEFIFILFPIL